ncbi:MAG: Epoxyqueuosine reductase QueG [Ktedonobacterales bacterium]|jgi:epoxyqueuosine reductase|nr:MAG: Epoxyqueuosine reductase QueG [Ktedonobacterales bacterium]
MSTTEYIKDRAYDLGFDLVRITSAEPFPEAEAALKERIAAGLMSGLDWFTAARAEVSCNPRALLPPARSVISLATFYLTDSPRDLTTSGDPHGRVSSYAWGDDYHDSIRARLEHLAAAIRTLAPPGDEKTILFVDTGRMVDRAVAQRAGLGWYGKNTLLLTKEWGSWVFLSEIVTSLELEPDQPLQTNCGQCELCLQACPTGAIIAPYVLDNRRCISYLTIELRGSIPHELRPLVGSHIFGCDICQEVCPVNHVAETRLHASGRFGARPRLEFQPRATVGSSPALIPLLALTEEEFRERFRRSPIKRAKRRGLLRNVCVALGNIGDPIAIPALAHALASHDEPLVRGHAAWGLGRIGGTEAHTALSTAAATDPDETVRAEARYALEMLATADRATE